jgi:hypothetical protein
MDRETWADGHKPESCFNLGKLGGPGLGTGPMVFVWRSRMASFVCMSKFCYVLSPAVYNFDGYL